MPKSVLGNDPFEAANIAPPPAKEEKKPKKKAKKATKTTKKATRKSSVGDKKSTKKSPTKTHKKTTKTTPKTKKTAAKKKTSVAKKKTATTIKKSDKAAKTLVKKQTITKKAKQPVKTQENQASNLIIGGGDPKLLTKFRPNGFSLGQEYGADPSFRKSMDSIISFFQRFYWRVSIKGAENLPKDGKAVLVGNHSGILPFDGLMISNAVGNAIGRNAWPLVEDFFYYAPVLGPALSKLGFIRACQENAQRLLAEDEMVLVFPEGIKGIVKPYKNRYRLQRFGRGGYIKLCLVSDAPIVPIAVIGAEEVHPLMTNLNGLAKMLGLPFFPLTPLFPLLGPFGLIPLPSKWTIVVGEPIYFNEFGKDAVNDRMAVSRLSEQVKGQIQSLIDTEISLRRSKWR